MNDETKVQHVLRITMLCQPERIDDVQDELRKLAADASGYDDMLLGKFLIKLEDLYHAPLRVGEWHYSRDTGKMEFRRLQDYELLYCNLSKKAYEAVIELFKFKGCSNRYSALWMPNYGSGSYPIPSCDYDTINELNHFHLMVGTSLIES